MLKFVNISAYLGYYACLFLLLKALTPMLLNIQALVISNYLCQLPSIKNTQGAMAYFSLITNIEELV